MESPYPGLIVLGAEPAQHGTWYDCAVERPGGDARIKLYQPDVNVLAAKGDVITPLPPNQIETLYLPREQGPCGGVNVAERILGSILDYVEGLPPEDKPAVFANHPPSKGAEKSQLYLNKGVRFTTDYASMQPGDVMLFSAHGADPKEVEKAQRRGLRVVNTTCTLVEKIHQKVRHASPAATGNPEPAALFFVSPLYEAGHPEVVGTRGVAESVGFKFVPVTSAEEALQVFQGEPQEVGPEKADLSDVRRVALAGLTTSNKREVGRIARRIQVAAEDSGIEVVPYSNRNVCKTVQLRQDAMLDVTANDRADTVVIAGAIRSNNTKELVRVAADGVRDSKGARLGQIIFANHFSQIPESLAGEVGLSSGASTQYLNVDQMVRRLNATRIEPVGKGENIEMFRPVGGPETTAARALAGDFGWLHEPVTVTGA